MLYLTNPESNECIIMAEMTDEAGNVLYRSGALRPGEYVERLYPLLELENVAIPIQMKVYAFEPETWYSLGTIALNNTLQPW